MTSDRGPWRGEDDPAEDRFPVEGEYKRFGHEWSGGTGGWGAVNPPSDVPPPPSGLSSLVIAEDPLIDGRCRAT